MAFRLISLLLAAALGLGSSCALRSTSSNPPPQPLFLPEYSARSHGSKTLFDRVVEFDPGTFRIYVSPEYRSNPPRRVAVLPFTDKGSGNYVLDKVPITIRRAEQLADWRWTDSNRLRKDVEGYLAQREFETVNTLEVDAVLAARGVDNDVKLDGVTPQELGRWLDVDAVVYGEVTHYEVYYFMLFVGWEVTLRLKMVSTETGCTLVAGIGTRNKNEITPALALRDIAFNSAVNLTDLRDVDLRSAEEEVARELVWRIPLSNYASATLARSSSASAGHRNVQTPNKAKVKEEQTSNFAQGQSVALGPSNVDIKANDSSPSTSAQSHLPEDGTQGGHASPAGVEVGSAWGVPLGSKEVSGLSIPRSARLTNPQAEAVSDNSYCPQTPSWVSEISGQTDKRPEIFFRKEKRIFRHGRKTILDRLIETDPETFPIEVSPQYYANPPRRVAVLPFSYTQGDNLKVDMIPVTFHSGDEIERWRWTVGNRVRRVFVAFLAQREFEIVSPLEVDAVLAQHGVRTFGDLMRVSPQQLGSWLDVDAVVYGHVSRYDGYYVFLIGGWTVGLRIRMVSTSNGKDLIKASGGRYALIIRPAFVLVDIFLESGINLVEALRDIRLMRAEEETCREIVLRIPEVPKLVQELQAQAVQRSLKGADKAKKHQTAMDRRPPA